MPIPGPRKVFREATAHENPEDSNQKKGEKPAKKTTAAQARKVFDDALAQARKVFDEAIAHENPEDNNEREES